MRKQRLMKRMLKLTAKKQQLDERCKASQDAAEVRSLTEQLEDINDEIEDIQAELDEIAEEEQRAGKQNDTVTRDNGIPAQAQKVNGDIGVNGTVVGSFASQQRSTENPYESMEYRQAFMHYVQRGTAIPQNLIDKITEYRNNLPAEMRAGVPVTTTDTGAAIPITVMREIINTVRKRYGNLYSKVRKMSIPGGVEFPIGALEASFKWINESTVSPRQRVGVLDKIEFKYHTGEIRVAQTFLSQILTMEEFEAKVVEVIAVAYMRAMDYGIVNGSGQGSMLGILNDPRVAATGNVVEMSAADISDWQAWRKKFFAKLPLGYRDGEFIFPLGTVDAYLETMADANNNPIFRQATGLEVNDGDARNPNGRFFGRDISLVEPDIISDFDTAQAGDVIGIFWQPEEYAINENFGFTMRRYFDEETNEWVDKALVIADGKVLNPNGIWIIKKK